MINLTLQEVMTATVLYGIVHGIWVVARHLETETGRIIKSHVKSGHKAHFKECKEDSCAMAVGIELS
jgi:hypothetical protein